MQTWIYMKSNTKHKVKLMKQSNKRTFGETTDTRILHALGEKDQDEHIFMQKQQMKATQEGNETLKKY